MVYVRRDLAYCKKYAERRGGQCLSTEYTNPNTLMTWKCAAGHVWEQTFNNVRRSSFCHGCNVLAGKKTTIETCHEYAQKHGGKCLSTKYINYTLPLKWECAVGHKWEQGWKNLYRSNFCTLCTRNMPANAVYEPPVKIPITLAECQDIAFNNGGICLSDEYINSKTDMSWECKIGHKWQATASSVCRKRKWCERCEDDKSIVDSGKPNKSIVDKDDVDKKIKQIQ